jgi:hypothetical protein
MDAYTPHRSILALHRPIDEALRTLLQPLGLDCITEEVLTIGRDDLAGLCAETDPHVALAALGERDDAPVLMVAEPALCSMLLARIWRTDHAPGSQLTQVERAILQEFLRDACGSWRSAWQSIGSPVVPTLTLAGTLTVVEPQLGSDAWHVARTAVLNGDEDAGVLLFCYPVELEDDLVDLRAATTWRARLERGLSDAEREQLNIRVRALGAVTIPTPVSLTLDLPLGAINKLERGDVIALEAQPSGELELNLLHRTISAGLARTGDKLALRIGGSFNAGGTAQAMGGDELDDLLNDIPDDPSYL